MSVPVPNAYWVEPGRLLAGEYPGARCEKATRDRLGLFLQADVGCFIDLTEEGELEPYQELLAGEAARRGVTTEYVRLPIRDVDVPHSREHMTEILDTVDRALARGLCVYVHCWGGSGRTGTVVGCHLVRGGFSGSGALERVAELWRTVEKHWRLDSPQTGEQRAWVMGWREGALTQAHASSGGCQR